MDVAGEIFLDVEKSRFFSGVSPMWLYSREINQFTLHL